MIKGSYNKKKLKFLYVFQKSYGIGFAKSQKAHKLAGLNLRISTFYLKKKHKRIMNRFSKKLVLNQKLKQYLKKIHDFAYSIKLYRGIRNKLGLPSRGQQTRTNAKTKKKLKV